MVEVIGDIPPPQPEEQEMLETLAANHPYARLACQIDVTGNLEIRKI
ncbi:hypothetical protein [Nostoc sp. 'Peltigera malacea cyanobiont' DB3992]|nr:hypothetical protein [Nostoc sp. 'Peltigera malacea cyanobiont' DB3992]